MSAYKLLRAATVESVSVWPPLGQWLLMSTSTRLSGDARPHSLCPTLGTLFPLRVLLQLTSVFSLSVSPVDVLSLHHHFPASPTSLQYVISKSSSISVNSSYQLPTGACTARLALASGQWWVGVVSWPWPLPSVSVAMVDADPRENLGAHGDSATPHSYPLSLPTLPSPHLPSTTQRVNNLVPRNVFDRHSTLTL